MRRITTVNGYIAVAPKASRDQLRLMRKTIRSVLPHAVEKLDIDLASFHFEFGGGIVWYGAWTKHVSLYPGEKAVKKFKKQLAGIDHNKGTIRWKHGAKLPVGLIKKMVLYRVEQALIDEDPDPP